MTAFDRCFLHHPYQLVVLEIRPMGSVVWPGGWEFVRCIERIIHFFWGMLREAILLGHLEWSLIFSHWQPSLDISANFALICKSSLDT